MAGWFGWRRASAVHKLCRDPNCDLGESNLEDKRLVDLTYWNDLYAVDSGA